MLERNMPIGRDDRQRLASFLWQGSWRCGIVTPWELLVVSQQLIGCEMSIDSDPERSIISNPFLQRMAILLTKKTTLYAFEGREKSCWIALTTTQKIPPCSSEISFVRTLYIRNPLERVFHISSWGLSGLP